MKGLPYRPSSKTAFPVVSLFSGGAVWTRASFGQVSDGNEAGCENTRKERSHDSSHQEGRDKWRRGWDHTRPRIFVDRCWNVLHIK